MDANVNCHIKNAVSDRCQNKKKLCNLLQVNLAKLPPYRQNNQKCLKHLFNKKLNTLSKKKKKKSIKNLLTG